jgi:hypothetical protein
MSTNYDPTAAIADANRTAAHHASEARKLEGSMVYVLTLANDESGVMTFGKDGKALVTTTPALFGRRNAARSVKANPGTVKAVKAVDWHRARSSAARKLANALANA